MLSDKMQSVLNEQINVEFHSAYPYLSMAAYLESANMMGMAAWIGGITMGKYRCIVCGYIYDQEIGDPDHGVSPGTSFGNLPDDWVCPECGAPKEQFEQI